MIETTVLLAIVVVPLTAIFVLGMVVGRFLGIRTWQRGVVAGYLVARNPKRWEAVEALEVLRVDLANEYRDIRYQDALESGSRAYNSAAETETFLIEQAQDFYDSLTGERGPIQVAPAARRSSAGGESRSRSTSN